MNGSGDYCQVEDHDVEKGRIKAFIKNERNDLPLHLIVGTSCHPHSLS